MEDNDDEDSEEDDEDNDGELGLQATTVQLLGFSGLRGYAHTCRCTSDPCDRSSTLARQPSTFRGSPRRCSRHS